LGVQVVVLMQQLTHSLTSYYNDCGRVNALLAYYRQHMARYEDALVFFSQHALCFDKQHLASYEQAFLFAFSMRFT
jgi:hypothetical protein